MDKLKRLKPQGSYFYIAIRCKLRETNNRIKYKIDFIVT